MSSATTTITSRATSVFDPAVQAAFHNEYYAVPVSAPAMSQDEEAKAVAAHNRARSIMISANCAAKNAWAKEHGAYPTKADEARMLELGLIKKLPGIRRVTGAGITSVNDMEVSRLKNRELARRDEQQWLGVVNSIEDENLRLAVAKRVWWDFFAGRGWTGLNELIHEDDGCRIFRFITHDTKPLVSDLRIALWQVGYPIQTIRTQFGDKFSYTIVTRDDD